LTNCDLLSIVIAYCAVQKTLSSFAQTDSRWRLSPHKPQLLKPNNYL
jgi:hypothetical protein